MISGAEIRSVAKLMHRNKGLQKMNGTGQLVLERCAKEADEVRQTQAFGLFYGEGMKGQNATLSAYMYGKNMSTALPYLGNLLRGEEPANVTEMVGGSTVGPKVLQIGDPKEES